MSYNDNPTTEWKIDLLKLMLKETIKWFHQVMKHPGIAQMYTKVKVRYHHHRLQHTIENIKCDYGQKYK